MNVKQSRHKRKINTIAAVLFFLYLSYLFYLTFLSTMYGRGYSHRSINAIPLKTILQYMSSYVSARIAVINLLGNIAAFVPMGVLLPIADKRFKSFLKVLLFSAGVSLMIEVAQYVFGVGAADIDDLLLNTAGGLLGFGVYKLAGFIYKRLARRHYMM